MDIFLVPTSHIARESVEKARKALDEVRPDAVAVELDATRFHILKNMGSMKEGSSILYLRSMGVFNFIMFWLMKKLQKRLGEMTGILPGSEMLEAVKAAQEKGLVVHLIDQDISVTFSRMGRMPFMEKLKLIYGLVRGLIGINLGKGSDATPPGMEVDLSKVPQDEIIEKALDFLEEKMPYLFNVLVKERNEYMAKRLEGMHGRERILVFIGAGHARGLRDILKFKHNVTIL